MVTDPEGPDLQARMLDLASTLVNCKRMGTRAVVFLGAGTAIASGGLTTDALVYRVLEEHRPRKSIPEEKRWQEFCELLGEKAHRDDRRNLFLPYFANLTTPSDGYLAVADLVRLGWVDRVLTTNFDPLLEVAFQRRDLVPSANYLYYTVGSDQDGLIARDIRDSRYPVVLKLHGDYLRGIMPFGTREEPQLEPELRSSLVALLSRNVLFVGYSARDGDVLRLLRATAGGQQVWFVNPRRIVNKEHWDSTPETGRRSMQLNDEFFRVLADRRSLGNQVYSRSADEGDSDQFFSHLLAAVQEKESKSAVVPKPSADSTLPLNPKAPLAVVFDGKVSEAGRAFEALIGPKGTSMAQDFALRMADEFVSSMGSLAAGKPFMKAFGPAVDWSWEVFLKQAQQGDVIIAASFVKLKWWETNRHWALSNAAAMKEKGVRFVRVFVFRDNKELRDANTLLRELQGLGVMVNVVYKSELPKEDLHEEPFIVGVNISDWHSPRNATKIVSGGRAVGLHRVADDRMTTILSQFVTREQDRGLVEDKVNKMTRYLKKSHPFDSGRWSEEFFADTQAYRDITLYREQSKDDELQFIYQLLAKHGDFQPGQMLADLGAGYGRLSIPLSSRYVVHAVEKDSRMFNELKTEIQRFRVPDGRVFALNRDVTDLRHNNTFSVALSWFTSFGYCSEDSANKDYLKSVLRLLKDKGLFILDVDNPLHYFAREEDKHLEDCNTPEVKIKRTDYHDPHKLRRWTNYLYGRQAEKSELRPMVSVRLFKRSELTVILEELRDNGHTFRVLECLGSYRMGDTYRESESQPRIVLVAQKVSCSAAVEFKL